MLSLGLLGSSDFIVKCMRKTVHNSNNYHMVDAIRMQMEVQRRLHEQLEVILFKHFKIIINIYAPYFHG